MRAGFHRGWLVVLGSGGGIAFGSVVFLGAGFALIASAMAREFGWSQVEAVKAATLFLATITLNWPITGWLLDRYGTRAVAAGGIILFAGGLLALSLVRDLTDYYLAFALMGLVSGSTNAIAYARAIALWFDRRRGLALGLATSLQGVGAALLPLIIQGVIAAEGWRGAVQVVAGLQILVCLPLVLALVRDDPKTYGLGPDGAPLDAGAAPSVAVARGGAGDEAEPAGLTLAEAARTRLFWLLLVSFFIAGGTGYALNANSAYVLLPLVDGDTATLARLISVGGAAVILGRFGFGHLLDVAPPPLVAGGIFILVIVHLTMVFLQAPLPFLMLGAFCVGMAGGGESDLMPFFASRYFGNRALARILGVFFFVWFLGAALAPLAFAQASAHFGGPAVPLLVLGALQCVPMAIFFGEYVAARRAR